MITKELKNGCNQFLNDNEISHEAIDNFHAPGAFELPFLAQACAQTKKYDAVICFGSVIRGETPHFDYVCKEVSRGLMDVGLKFSLPVIFGVLTTDNLEQAQARIGGIHGHKGIECAQAALESLKTLQKIQNN